MQMKPANVKYIDFVAENNDKDTKLEVADRVRHFCDQKIKNTVPWTYVIEDLNGGEIVGTFYWKVIKKKGDKSYAK